MLSGFVRIGDVMNTGVCEVETDAGQLNSEIMEQ